MSPVSGRVGDKRAQQRSIPQKNISTNAVTVAACAVAERGIAAKHVTTLPGATRHVRGGASEHLAVVVLAAGLGSLRVAAIPHGGGGGVSCVGVGGGGGDGRWWWGRRFD